MQNGAISIICDQIADVSGLDLLFFRFPEEWADKSFDNTGCMCLSSLASRP